MASSTVTGDRRLASTRRGGMTVLGKVAVPKPINLPSQRLENHGLDPNVEIVPKGTLSWGSRPSSAGSNAWGTSALSPTTDGSSSSPSHLLGRPSSGGGTRPSTAGSERAHDSNVNVWGSNSRPSSASGVLASNHASAASSRPRSADNRPGSSHLSRFAEPAPEGSGVWGATGAAERMGVASSAKEGFSLSTGDFPTLGSEKDESKMNMEPLDHASHGRPGSSGGVRTMADSRGIAHGDDVFRNSDVRGNSWRKDGPPFVEDGPRPSMERWHGEPHLHPNPNMAPPHYESWRGAQPVNPPGGVWYRGPPGPPYGGPVPPGGFPMEPFPYYHPQVPAPGLGSSQPLPPGAGHHGHHPNNGDRPHMPHVPHLHPGMPMRPGFYPGPVPYDGYYRPPMGFCNPNERDLPFMGMPVGPPVYSRHANQNAPDLNNAHPRSREGRGPEQVEPGPPHDPRGHYKVLVNPNDGWNPNDEEKWGHRVTNSAIVREKGILSRTPLQENTWEDDYKKNEDIHYGKSTSIEVSSHSSDKKFASNIHSNMTFPERLSNIDEAQMSPAMDDVAPPQDHSLIQKIEGLNAKARATGEKQEGFHIEDSNDRVQMVDAKNHRYVNEANSDVVLERHFPTGVLVPVSRNNDVSATDKSQESAIASVTAAPRRSVRGAQSRGNPHAKGRFSGQEAEGWGMKSDSQSMLEASSRFTNNDEVEEHNAAAQTAEVSRTNVQGKDDGESVVSSIDASDMQRAKMREIAKQRAIQLQKEEEERVREQKAKALAKLEELNRRSANQAVENPIQKETSAPPGHVSKKQDLSGNQPEPSADADHSTGSSSAASNKIAQNNVKSASKSLDSAVSSRHLVAELKRSDDQEDSFSSRNALPTADTNVDDAVSHRTEPQVREVKQKRGYKQRQNVPLEKNPVQDAISSGRTDMLKDLKVASSAQEVTANMVDSGVRKEQAESPVTAADIPVQRKRVNKSGKNRHKVEELSTGVSLSVTQLQDSNLAQANPEIGEQNGSSLHVNSISMQLSVDPKDAIQSSENHSSLLREDTHGRVNNASKAQHSRKPKSSQSNRSSEKTQSNDAVVWAPVRSHNKLEATDQPSQKAAEPLVSSVAEDNLVQNSSRTKRAEMERYVPKPVAKELAQQVSIQQPLSPSIVPAEIDGSGGREKASHGSEKAGASMDSKHVDSKNRHQRAQGSWRQRFSTESSIASSQDSSAYTSKNIQTSGSHSTVKSDESFVSGKPSRPDELSEKGPQTSISDGWECANDSSSNSLAAATGLKDQIPAGRGKRHPYKGQKGSGNSQNFDHKDSNVGLTDLQCSHVDANRMEKTVSSKEIRAAGDRSGSHWQPKSQGYVAVNQQGNRSRGSQNTIAEDSKALKSETGPNTGLHPSSQRNQSAAKNPVTAPENKGAVEAKPSMGYQEAKRDKRVASVKGRPHFPSQEPEASVGDFELDSFGAMDGHNEQRPFSGNRKSSNHSGRFNRGHEPRGDWSSGAQENKQHYLSANRERQRQNLHYKYQPVGPHNGSSRSNESGVPTESQSGASRFRERGQSNSRRGRGNFHGRQSGNED